MLALSTADTNIHYLGQAGLKTLQGLNVAYLDGTYNEAAYTTDPKDMDSFTGCRHYTKVSRSPLRPSGFVRQHSRDIFGNAESWCSNAG